MDIQQARTFLAVVESGSFVDAAKRVNVTQSTVSMRIRALEEQLGKTLFQRSKAGASVTAAGAQFHKHALTIVRVWEQARHEVALPAGFTAGLTVGGQYSLCDGFLLAWLARMHVKAPNVAIRMQVGFSDLLMQRLVNGTIDLGIMYTPQSRPGFEVEMLFEEELILVSSEARPPNKPGKNYVYIDWGPEFQSDHSLNYPELATPGIFLELGSLGLKYLLDNPASGYVPRRLAERHLKAGSLKNVAQAPAFFYPVYAVYPTDAEPQLRKLVLKNLRETAAFQVKA